jgi:hypothetical protein
VLRYLHSDSFCAVPVEVQIVRQYYVLLSAKLRQLRHVVTRWLPGVGERGGVAARSPSAGERSGPFFPDARGQWDVMGQRTAREGPSQTARCRLRPAISEAGADGGGRRGAIRQERSGGQGACGPPLAGLGRRDELTRGLEHRACMDAGGEGPAARPKAKGQRQGQALSAHVAYAHDEADGKRRQGFPRSRGRQSPVTSTATGWEPPCVCGC